MQESAITEQLEKYLRALVLLQLDSQRDDGEAPNHTVLLSRAGFSSAEVADLLGKNVPAIQKAVQRARKSGAFAR
jgi:DNA-directed RNA polymerase specialized sigma24 family protein